MGIFKPSPSDIFTKLHNGEELKVYKKETYHSFSESILGLGDIKEKSQGVDAISVFFDLEGFTTFCTTVDPHLEVPIFLSSFLKWIFDQIRGLLLIKEFKEGYATYSDFPFMSKYLGDGLLFLWDTRDMKKDVLKMNIISMMMTICLKYEQDFVTKHLKGIADPPKKLRCGIASGMIHSVGNGGDYVGACINMSARLQKLSLLSFCFLRRGMDPDLLSDSVKPLFITKKVQIRGTKEELVCILEHEFNRLPDSEKVKFKNA